ncbi:MAG: hypothetical protein U0736_22625 [Gemmataceae bacterium]
MEHTGGGLGLRLEGVSLHDLHLLLEVVQGYHDVTRAMERATGEVTQAEADRPRRRREQEGRSLEVVRQAEAERHEKVRLAARGRTEFFRRTAGRSGLDMGRRGRAAAGRLAGRRRRPDADRAWPPVSATTAALASAAALTDFRPLLGTR